MLIVDLDVQRNLASALGLGVLEPTPVGEGVVSGGRRNLLYASWKLSDDPKRAVVELAEGVRSMGVAVVVVDTPPASNSLEARAALAVCEWLLVPMRCDSHSMDGLVTLIQQAGCVGLEGYTMAMPLAICLFAVNPRATRFLEATQAELASLLGDNNLRVLNTTVRTAERAHGKALNLGLTAGEYAANHKQPANAALLAADYTAAANEIESLIASRQKG